MLRDLYEVKRDKKIRKIERNNHSNGNLRKYWFPKNGEGLCGSIKIYLSCCFPPKPNSRNTAQ